MRRTFVFAFTFLFTYTFEQAFPQVDINVRKVEKSVYLGTYIVSENRLVPPENVSLRKRTQEDTLFNNTETDSSFIYLSDLGQLPQEVIDWGTTIGGTITSFRFTYVTSLTSGQAIGSTEATQTVLVEAQLYWGTDYDTDGNQVRSIPLSLQFSQDGTPTAYTVDVDISNNPLNFPPGRFGYGLKFESPSLQSGPLLAKGGKGATNLFRIKPLSENNLRFTDGRFGQFYFQLRGTFNDFSTNAQDDTYNTIGNVGISANMQHSLLNNDAGADTVLTADRSTEQGGLINIDKFGQFTYTPILGLTGLDRFTYFIRDTDGKPSCAQATIDLSNHRIWFIKNGASGKNIGSFSNPFQSLSDFEQSQDPQENDIVYFYDSNQPYVSGINLQDGQCLLGQGIDLVNTIKSKTGMQVEPYTDLAQNAPPQGERPTITSNSGAGIELAKNNFIGGLRIHATLEYGIKGVDFGSVDISTTSIHGSGGALSLRNGNAEVELDTVESVDAAEDGIWLSGVSGNFTIGKTSISNPFGIGLRVEDSDADFKWTASLSYTGKFGISLRNNLTSSFDFKDVQITNSDTTGFFADSSGTINIDSGSINTANGVAVKIKNTNLGINFDSISADGGRAGIFLKYTTGSFTVNGGLIQNSIKNGVFSKNAEGLRLRNLEINNSGKHAIMRFGTRVDLDAQNLNIDGSGYEGIRVGLSLKSKYPEQVSNSGLMNKFILKDSQILNTAQQGVNVQAGGTDSLEVTISGNTITTASKLGLTVQTSDSGFALVELDNNTVTADSIDFQLIQDSTSTFALKGFAGGDSAAAVSYIQDNNVGTPSVSITGTIRAENVTTVSGPDEPRLPTKFALQQNYPNPFNPSTTINYSLEKAGQVQLKIFDLLGREVRSLIDENKPKGEFSVAWDGKDNSGKRVASGYYFYRLESGENQSTRRMILLK